MRRINRHPSNAQWAGGNEIEGIVIGVNNSLANGTHYLNEVSVTCRSIPGRGAGLRDYWQFQTLFGESWHDIVLEEESSVSSGKYISCF